ncbi:hypothetical protein TNCV_3400421 [Trichonephila clavipes]|nr:hypothetical protein TNCV_3400421 [Trichonephila clavipes]
MVDAGKIPFRPEHQVLDKVKEKKNPCPSEVCALQESPSLHPSRLCLQKSSADVGSRLKSNGTYYGVTESYSHSPYMRTFCDFADAEWP